MCHLPTELPRARGGPQGPARIREGGEERRDTRGGEEKMRTRAIGRSWWPGVTAVWLCPAARVGMGVGVSGKGMLESR